ncbi:synaptojanin-1-like isoform X2 [Lutra lutra]|uniref:synaptojanin-1-like isoform X2 n=1 Tax=Lutra lutra TaxID=9657 RepID=UPI001FD5B755|nr:synaptojanin-1-like isoform X2 [Lutra lutra]
MPSPAGGAGAAAARSPLRAWAGRYVRDVATLRGGERLSPPRPPPPAGARPPAPLGGTQRGRRGERRDRARGPPMGRSPALARLGGAGEPPGSSRVRSSAGGKPRAREPAGSPQSPTRPAAQLGSAPVAAAPGLLSRARPMVRPLPTLFRSEPHLPAPCTPPASSESLKDLAARSAFHNGVLLRVRVRARNSTGMQAPRFTASQFACSSFSSSPISSTYDGVRYDKSMASILNILDLNKGQVQCFWPLKSSFLRESFEYV